MSKTPPAESVEGIETFKKSLNIRAIGFCGAGEGYRYKMMFNMMHCAQRVSGQMTLLLLDFCNSCLGSTTGSSGG